MLGRDEFAELLLVRTVEELGQLVEIERFPRHGEQTHHLLHELGLDALADALDLLGGPLLRRRGLLGLVNFFAPALPHPLVETFDSSRQVADISRFEPQCFDVVEHETQVERRPDGPVVNGFRLIMAPSQSSESLRDLATRKRFEIEAEVGHPIELQLGTGGEDEEDPLGYGLWKHVNDALVAVVDVSLGLVESIDHDDEPLGFLALDELRDTFELLLEMLLELTQTRVVRRLDIELVPPRDERGDVLEESAGFVGLPVVRDKVMEIRLVLPSELGEQSCLAQPRGAPDPDATARPAEERKHARQDVLSTGEALGVEIDDAIEPQYRRTPTESRQRSGDLLVAVGDDQLELREMLSQRRGDSASFALFGYQGYGHGSGTLERLVFDLLDTLVEFVEQERLGPFAAVGLEVGEDDEGVETDASLVVRIEKVQHVAAHRIGQGIPEAERLPDPELARFSIAVAMKPIASSGLVGHEPLGLLAQGMEAAIELNQVVVAEDGEARQCRAEPCFELSP